ncbi:MAG: arsenate reductase ArsC [Thermoanaerobaculia bacterium]
MEVLGSRRPHRVLVLCTGNSARSQMAEGLLRELGGDAVEAASAGVRPWEVHPLAIQVMAERGIDIGDYRSKSVDELAGREFGTVITVCDHAAQTCPAWVGRSARVHWSIPDPVELEGREREQLEAFRDTRDLLEERLSSWLTDNDLLPPRAAS